MQTSVDLQEPFTYSWIFVIIIGFIVAIFTFYLIFSKKTKRKKNVKGIPEKHKKNFLVIRGKYLNHLDSIEYKYQKQKIELREAYQLISEAIRMFVFEITDITTQNYTLAEIEKLNMPILYEMIKEYYEPEFASKTVGDFNDSINKARRVIKTWS